MQKASFFGIIYDFFVRERGLRVNLEHPDNSISYPVVLIKAYITGFSHNVDID